MQCHIRGNNSEKLTNNEIRYAAHFFLYDMMGSRLTEKLTLFINRLKLSPTHYGNTTYIDSNERPREFTIELNYNLPYNQQIKALAHEMVHVKQYSTGEMKDYIITANTRWQGTMYSPMDYYSEPWEIDAYGRENGLIHRYYEHAREKSLSFDKRLNFKKINAGTKIKQTV